MPGRVRGEAQGRSPFCLSLVNMGAGAAHDVTLRFRLHAAEKEEADVDWDGEYPHVFSIGEVGENGATADLSDFFSKGGADMALIRRLETSEARAEGMAVPNETGDGLTVVPEADWNALNERASGPFKQGVGVVIGELSYRSRSWAGDDSQNIVKLWAPVLMYRRNLLGVPRPPSYEYHAHLETDAGGYQRVISISHEIKHGETDHFLVNLGFDKPSRHRFRAKLRYLGADTSGELLAWESLPIVLSGFAAKRGIIRPTTVVEHVSEASDEGAKPPGAPSLRVVDVAADDTDCPTKLDIKARNMAAEPCFVKAVEIDVLTVGVLYTWYRPNLQPVTAEYDVDLDPREVPVPYVIAVGVSQVIAPQDADRFVLRVAYSWDFDWFVHDVLVQATVRLVYNEDSATTEPFPLLFAVRPSWKLRVMRTEPVGVSGQKLVANRRTLDTMLTASGKASPRIEALRAAVERGEWPDAAKLGVTPGEPPSHLRIRFGTAPMRSTAKQRVFRR